MAEVLRMHVTGMEKLEAMLRLFGTKAQDPLGQALYMEAEKIMTESVKIVPVDWGTLKGSRFVRQPVREGRTVVVVLGYGGAAAPYAWAVHENPRSGRTGGVGPQGQHYKHWARTGEWKFLEKPALAAQVGLSERIAAYLRGRLGKT